VKWLRKVARRKLTRMKRVVVGFPEDILEGMDDIVVETNKTRSLFIREACCFYMEKVKRENMRERMKAGYIEMAEINRLLAEEIACDFDCSPKLGYADEYCAHAMESIFQPVTSQRFDKWGKS
jgi:CopG family transcriptional regulator/antitoxin EndoAI